MGHPFQKRCSTDRGFPQVIAASRNCRNAATILPKDSRGVLPTPRQGVSSMEIAALVMFGSIALWFAEEIGERMG
jgi:hypothetical protein